MGPNPVKSTLPKHRTFGPQCLWAVHRAFSGRYVFEQSTLTAFATNSPQQATRTRRILKDADTLESQKVGGLTSWGIPRLGRVAFRVEGLDLRCFDSYLQLWKGRYCSVERELTEFLAFPVDYLQYEAM